MKENECLRRDRFSLLRCTAVPDSQQHLYRHSTQCSVALNVFLTCQPNYWCFVPITTAEAMIDDTQLTMNERSILNDHGSQNNPQTVSEYNRDSSLVHWCLAHVPLPPPNYQFSVRQRIEQYCFFRDRLDLFPSRFLDLYNAAIVIASRKYTSM